ncbi:MAG: YitT family protein [Lachnospiraceae bacterium]|nr:YitT family protein [Lachnospiraceae bacterium]
MKRSKKDIFSMVLIWAAASAIYCSGVNFFIVPGALYSGGFTGISQLLALFFRGTSLEQYNLRGIIYFLINVPVFLVGIKALGLKNMAKAPVVVAFESLFLSILPVPKAPLISDVLVNTVLGGLLEGAGCGLLYAGFGMSGGTDTIGVILSRRFRAMSVGKVSLAVNAVVYLFCAFLFNLETAVYSLIAAFVCSFIADKIHLQNKSVTVNVFTDDPDKICKWIQENLGRGTTVLQGVGSYTHNVKYMVVGVMSRYELRQFQRSISDIDSAAFVFIDPDVSVIGNYEKRLS